MDLPLVPSWKRRHWGERMGRYVLGASIGVGGAAAVYLARLVGPEGFERLLAIKIVHDHLVEDRQFIAMFLDEANLAVRLSHPNIVHTYELGREGERLFIAMELLRGKPLSIVQERAFASRSPLAYDLVAWLGARCADALYYAHELRGDDGNPLNIVHRDISPDNLFVTYDGDLKIIDFGIARAEGRLTQSRLGTVKGKFRYMSPEYALGQTFDHTLDLFALGATLYEASVGRAAFEAEDIVGTLDRLVMGDFAEPREVREDFPPELSLVLRKAMNPVRQERYTTGLEMAHDLDQLVTMRSSEVRARLSTRMRELFAREIEEEEAALAVMRSGRFAPLPSESTSLDHSVSRPAPSTDSSAVRIGIGAGAGLFAAIGIAATLIHGSGREGPRPLAASAMSPSAEAAAVTPAATRDEPPVGGRVTIDVAVLPSDAITRIRVGEQTVTSRPARVQLLRGAAPVPVEVSGEGFLASKLEIVPDHDQSIVVPLNAAAVAPLPWSSRSRRAAPPRPPASSGAAHDTSGVIHQNPFVGKVP